MKNQGQQKTAIRQDRDVSMFGRFSVSWTNTTLPSGQQKGPAVSSIKYQFRQTIRIRSPAPAIPRVQGKAKVSKIENPCFASVNSGKGPDPARTGTGSTCKHCSGRKRDQEEQTRGERAGIALAVLVVALLEAWRKRAGKMRWNRSTGVPDLDLLGTNLSGNRGGREQKKNDERRQREHASPVS